LICLEDKIGINYYIKPEDKIDIDYYVEHGDDIYTVVDVKPSYMISYIGYIVNKLATLLPQKFV